MRNVCRSCLVFFFDILHGTVLLLAVFVVLSVGFCYFCMILRESKAVGCPHGFLPLGGDFFVVLFTIISVLFRLLS